MTQDELKQQAALRALDYVIEGSIVGVGTGSTANFFIDGLATMKDRIVGAVLRSLGAAAGHGIRLFDMNDVDDMPVYVDGADEIDGPSP
jgi:ribose 5-phosphate isomerase A